MLSIQNDQSSHSTSIDARLTPTENPRHNSIELPAEICYAAQRGFSVFPVRTTSINTLAAYELLNQATSSLAHIEELASPGCNFALATGEDLFAIKIDGEVDAASFSELASKELGYNDEDWGRKTLVVHGQMIIYALFTSPEKGLHLRPYNTKIAPGLVIRGSGDWIPLPPSRFSGVKYFYEAPGASVAVAPKFLADLVFLPDGEAEDVLPIRFPPRRAEPEYFPASGKRGAGPEPRSAVGNGAPMYGGCGWHRRFQISRRC